MESEMASESTKEVAVPELPKRDIGVVFAYNGSDHDAVVQIYDRLKQRGLAPWIDSRDHRPGADCVKDSLPPLTVRRRQSCFLGRMEPVIGWNRKFRPFISSARRERLT